jgi:hypothetical protein
LRTKHDQIGTLSEFLDLQGKALLKGKVVGVHPSNQRSSSLG